MGWGQKQAMRTEGSGSSLTQWSWVGGRCHIISQQTNSKQEEQREQACFQSFAKLPPGDWWLLFHGRTFSLLPYFLNLIIVSDLGQPYSAAQMHQFRQKIGGLCYNWLEKYTDWLFERECGWSAERHKRQKLNCWKCGRKTELVKSLLADSEAVPNPFFQHKLTKRVSTCPHPLFAQDADSIIATFSKWWHIAGPTYWISWEEFLSLTMEVAYIELLLFFL